MAVDYSNKIDETVLVRSVVEAFGKLSQSDQDEIMAMAVKLVAIIKERSPRSQISIAGAMMLLAAIGLVPARKRFSDALKEKV